MLIPYAYDRSVQDLRLSRDPQAWRPIGSDGACGQVEQDGAGRSADVLHSIPPKEG